MKHPRSSSVCIIEDKKEVQESTDGIRGHSGLSIVCHHRALPSFDRVYCYRHVIRMYSLTHLPRVVDSPTVHDTPTCTVTVASIANLSCELIEAMDCACLPLSCSGLDRLSPSFAPIGIRQDSSTARVRSPWDSRVSIGLSRKDSSGDRPQCKLWERKWVRAGPIRFSRLQFIGYTFFQWSRAQPMRSASHIRTL